VEQDWDAPAGVLTDWAAGEGLTLQTVQVHAGAPFPAVSPGHGAAGDDALSYDAVVVLGSEHTAYDDSLPWLAAEMTFLEGLLAQDIPVLGICFGGQLLSRVLGGRLYRLTAPEVGWQRLTSRSPAIAAGPWLSWHYDAFTLPPGATELATNDTCLQAFSLGPHTGVQFHPEATGPIVASWLASSQSPPAQEITAAMFGENSTPAWDQASANATTLFSAWLDGSLALRPGAQRVTSR
jgi:GMP synthase-like glutamine amidotransferase